MDELQNFRMLVVWPVIVGCAGFLLARSLLWLVAPKHSGRDHALACMVAGGSGVLMALAISLRWDGSSGYWMFFTLGLAVLAGIMLLTVALSALGMWHGH
jgi:hypothetical protein